MDAYMRGQTETTEDIVAEAFYEHLPPPNNGYLRPLRASDYTNGIKQKYRYAIFDADGDLRFSSNDVTALYVEAYKTGFLLHSIN